MLRRHVRADNRVRDLSPPSQIHRDAHYTTASGYRTQDPTRSTIVEGHKRTSADARCALTAEWVAAVDLLPTPDRSQVVRDGRLCPDDHVTTPPPGRRDQAILRSAG
jgi:hypothetical protein